MFGKFGITVGAGVIVGVGVANGATVGIGVGVAVTDGGRVGIGVAVKTGVGVGVAVSAGVGVEVATGVVVGVGVGTTTHDGTVIVSVSLVTVPPNANDLPLQVVLAPIVTPALLMTVPAKVVLAASVVAAIGVQNTSQADAPDKVTIAPAVEVSAPPDRKMYVPLPLSVSGPPTFIAPELQYTPGT